MSGADFLRSVDSSETTKGLRVDRIYTKNGIHPYDEVQWVRKDVVLTNWRDGTVNFEQRGVEFPDFWADNAVNIVTSKYFRGALDSDQRENSLKQLIDRVVKKYVETGSAFGYFESLVDADIFGEELTYMLLHQIFSFNSPVWFNVGTSSRQQTSACYILSVEDTMSSILDWYREEGLIFKGGSGAGVNLSKIRSSKELLSTGGQSSGPVSFMRGADASAGTIKSGGKTRRAAKMVVLDVDHPDIEEFVESKAKEEDKIRALKAAGFDMDLGGDDSFSVQYQNANNSVRVSDKFMRAVEEDDTFDLLARKTGKTLETVKARDLWSKICTAAWKCADPGIQYDDTINSWHTCPESGRISASNPCFVGDTLVAVADGRNAVAIRDLVGSSVYVYASGSDGNLHRKLMKNIRKTRESVAVYKVTLDDGSIFRATSDHLIMLRDGSYCSVEDLVVGSSLMPFDSVVRPMGWGNTPRRFVRSGGRWNRQYWMISGRELFDFSKDGLTVDHINGDSLDDSSDNLQLISNSDNIRKCMLGDSNPARRCMSDEWRSKIGKAVSKSNALRYDSVSDVLWIEVWELSQASYPNIKPWNRWNKYIRKNGLVGSVPYVNGDRKIRGLDWSDFEEWVQSLKSKVTPNHSVVSVCYDGIEDVYDGEVEDLHNFGIITSVDGDIKTGTLSGVFVHNCSEVMFLDNSSCNLASVNLLKFLKDDNRSFDTEKFVRSVDLIVKAMEISICFGQSPIEKIDEVTREFRPLGIGYTNLGALLMASGLAYDSEAGRSLAAAVTSLMSAVAYCSSAEMAGVVGTYDGYARNADPHKKIIKRHANVSRYMGSSEAADEYSYLWNSANLCWDDAIKLGDKHGYRNANVSVLAPTGTIGLAMGCDTTGIEPSISLVAFKKLVGGGSMQIVNGTVSRALKSLGYQGEQIEAITEYIADTGHVVDAPALRKEHYSVFDCAMGIRPISPMGHVRMMAAVQPFISGAISKTVNMPETATVDDIAEVYMQGWKLGVKALAVYRDKCKVGQPLSDKSSEKVAEQEYKTLRKRLPTKRPSQTYSFSVSGAEGYMTASSYPDNGLGEIFLKMSKQGSTLAGVMDAFAIAVSIGLQHGVPLETFVKKFTNMRFEPSGLTRDPDVRIASSLVDYIFRRLALDYLSEDERIELGILSAEERSSKPSDEAKPAPVSEMTDSAEYVTDAPMCFSCGSRMRPAGSCYVCEGCGTTSGCS